MDEKGDMDAGKALATQYYMAYKQMLQLTGSKKEATRLTQSLFTAIFEGNKPHPEPGAGGFTIYWDRR